jgi:hypothetical protein
MPSLRGSKHEPVVLIPIVCAQGRRKCPLYVVPNMNPLFSYPLFVPRAAQGRPGVAPQQYRVRVRRQLLLDEPLASLSGSIYKYTYESYVVP